MDSSRNVENVQMINMNVQRKENAKEFQIVVEPNTATYGMSATNEQLIKLVDPKSSYHLISQFTDISNLTRILGSDKEKGISSQSLQSRINKYGSNEMPPPKTYSFFHFLFTALKELMVIFLVIAAAITVSAGIYQTIAGETNAWLEGVAILAAIGIIAGVNSINDYRKQSQFRQLHDTSKSLKSVKIVRDSLTLQVPTKELVVGDIVYVSMGDVLPCDGVLVESHYIKTDESSMTGESDQIVKDIDSIHETFDPFMLSGTTVVDGSGKMLVIAVGEHSLQGRAMRGLSLEPPPTPLQIKLRNLAKRLAIIGLVTAIVTLILLLILFFVKTGTSGNIIDGLVDVLLVGISIIVMAIPEGLPLAVTLSLAYATIHMLKDNNLVRHLSACETMGGATVICSDKTGTLTENQMSVVRADVLGKSLSRQDINLESRDERQDNNNNIFNSEHFEHLSKNIAVNSEAYEANVKNVFKFIGSKTDVALLRWITPYNVDYLTMRKESNIQKMIPFSSERKRMTTEICEDNNGCYVYTKGAAEIVLDLCGFLDDGMNIVPLTTDIRENYLKLIEDYAKNSLRGICCAYKKKDHEYENTDERNTYILQGLFGIEDPLRKNAAESVGECQKAGVKVLMVTGDNALTAQSIARQCNIISEEDSSESVIEGPVFRTLTTEQIDERLPKIKVMARSSPNDKLLLVEALKRNGETVAVTGDGANDGPALKNAHVGFSMGITGTEVAKEASAIVLLDDNFASIVKAIMWGRAVYAGIQRFITFQISVNISAVIITIVTSVASAFVTGYPISALTTLQILMLNLVADSLAALALSTDPPTRQLLDRKPHKQSDHIITKNMWIMIAFQSFYQTSVGLLIFYLSPLTFVGTDIELIRTLVFNTFVYMVLFNELNCRSITKDFNIFRGLRKNKFFLPLFISGLAVQYVIVTYLGIIFETVPLGWELWIFSVVVGAGSLLVGVIARLFFN